MTVDYAENLPETTALADRARALPRTTTPPTPGMPTLPVQARFHRHFTGSAVADGPEIRVGYHDGKVQVKLRNGGCDHLTFKVKSNAYAHDAETETVRGGDAEHLSWSLRRSGYWYDFTVTVKGLGGWSRRCAGRVETGRDSYSDPAMGGPALGEQE